MVIQLSLILFTCYLVVDSVIVNEVNDTYGFNEDLFEDEDFIDKRAILTHIMPEWDFPIPYSVDIRLNNHMIDNIIQLLEELTCITFIKVRIKENKMIRFVKSGMCGIRRERPQRRVIHIGGKCNKRGKIIQMVLKVLGSVSEERRPDRDQFLFINRQNIMPGAMRCFTKLGMNQVDTNSYRYDYGSILHNGRIYYSRNRRMTLVPRNTHYVKTIGQLSEIGFNDIKALNMHYCYDSCTVELDCDNFGYTDPNDCTQCRCPRLYTGIYCDEIESSTANCGHTLLTATDNIQTLDVSGIKTCVYHIEAPLGSIIQFELVLANLPIHFICPPNNGLEVKFQEDKSVSGAMFCGFPRNVRLRSTSNDMVLKYVGLQRSNFVTIEYHVV